MLILQRKVRVRLGEVYENMQIYANRVYSGTKVEGIEHGNIYTYLNSNLHILTG